MANVGGTVCYINGVERVCKKTKNLKLLVDELLYGGYKIVWVECKNKFKTFNALTPIKEIRNKVDGLCSQGQLL